MRFFPLIRTNPQSFAANCGCGDRPSRRGSFSVITRGRDVSTYQLRTAPHREATLASRHSGADQAGTAATHRGTVATWRDTVATRRHVEEAVLRSETVAEEIVDPSVRIADMRIARRRRSRECAAVSRHGRGRSEGQTPSVGRWPFYPTPVRRWALSSLQTATTRDLDKTSPPAPRRSSPRRFMLWVIPEPQIAG